MSSKLLPLILLASIPSASENLAAGYHVGQQWMNTATGIMYQCTGDGAWKQQYGYNDSPTFSSVTAIGSATLPNGTVSMTQLSAGAVRWVESAATANNRIWDVIVNAETWQLRTPNDAYSAAPTLLSFNRAGAATFGGQITCQGGLIRQNGGDGEVTAVASNASTAAWLVTLTDKNDYNGIRSTTSSYVDRWRIGRFGETSGIAFYEGVTRALYVTAAAPIAPNSGEVCIGGGKIDAYGSVIVRGGSAADVSDPAIRINNNRILTFLDSSGTNTNCGFVWLDSSNQMNIGAGNATVLRALKSGAADEMGLYLYDVTSGTLKRVTRGAANSGGSGYRLLRIAN